MKAPSPFPLRPRFLALLLLFPPSSPAQSPSTSSVPTLPAITITATRQTTPLSAVPAAVRVVDVGALSPGQPALALDAALNRVPGVFPQNSYNFAQDMRLSIRGFGTRAPFGVRELKVLVDGLPETGPDGQTETDAIDLGTLQRMEVLRGPASALYGNAAGGVISLETEDGPAQPTLTSEFLTGSDGLQQARLKAGGQAGDLNAALNGTTFAMDGYRDHSASRSTLWSGKARYALAPESDLTAIYSGLDSPEADDPGALTRAQVEADRRQARDLNVALDAGETVRQNKVGVIYHALPDSGQELTLGTYVLGRNLDSRLPILPASGGGIVALDRNSGGGGATYALPARAGGFDHHVSFGLDVQQQLDDRQRFNNEAGQSGALRFDQQETVTGLGAFLRDAIALHDDIELSGAVRYDRVRFHIDDHFIIDGDDSGSRTLDQFSPLGGLLIRPAPDWQLYANIATAFQVPTTTELANPDEGGGLNPQLDPQTALSYETGLRGVLLERLHCDLALFWIELDDALLPFEGASGRTFFRNAGASRRRGLEAALELPISAAWNWSLAYTAMDATFNHYPTPAGDFDGNAEPGIPSQTCFSELAYRRSSGLYGALNGMYVANVFTDDANAEHNDEYAIFNLRSGYDLHVGDLHIEPFIALNNFANEKYNGLVRLNAAAGRYFEPAPTRTLSGGLLLSHAF